MATKRIVLAVATLLIATLACGGNDSNLQATISAQNTQIADLGGDVQVTSTTIPASSPTTVSPPNTVSPQVPTNIQSECETDKWRIFPIGKVEQPSSSGLKKILIQFAVENNSPYWGTFQIGRDTQLPFVTTEGGFSYSALRDDFEGYYVSGAFQAGPIAPGLIASGDPDPFQMLFEVAESQQSLTVVFPSFTVLCFKPDGKFDIESNSTATIINNDLRQPPFSSQYESLKSVSEPIDIETVGTFEFLDVSRVATEDKLLKLRFKFTNASAGYETSGYVSGYLIDSHGVIHRNGNGFSAGPGQSTEMEMAFFVESKKPDEFALAIISINTDVAEIAVYQLDFCSTLTTESPSIDR